MLRENVLKEVPRLNKNCHKLPNISQRILRSPMPNEHPDFIVVWITAYFIESDLQISWIQWRCVASKPLVTESSIKLFHDCIRCSSGASASLHWFEIIIKPRKTPKQSTFFGFPCLVFFYSHINLWGSSKISSRVFFFLKSIVFLHLLQKVMASQPGLS